MKKEGTGRDLGAMLGLVVGTEEPELCSKDFSLKCCSVEGSRRNLTWLLLAGSSPTVPSPALCYVACLNPFSLGTSDKKVVVLSELDFST